MKRSKKILFVSHALLNQNSMPKDRGKYPGMVTDLIELLSEAGVGIIQLPCPELSFGAPINRKQKTKEIHDTKPFRKHCKSLASDIMDQVEKYTKSKYKVIGLLGVEFSPIEAVHQIDTGSKIIPGRGIFMEEIETQMKKKRIQVPLLGINLNNIYSSMEKVQSLLNCS